MITFNSPTVIITGERYQFRMCDMSSNITIIKKARETVIPTRFMIICTPLGLYVFIVRPLIGHTIIWATWLIRPLCCYITIKYIQFQLSHNTQWGTFNVCKTCPLFRSLTDVYLKI